MFACCGPDNLRFPLRLRGFEILSRHAMLWIAPSEKDTATDTLEKRLWAAADQFRANSGLSAAQYSQPVLGVNNAP